MITSFILQPAKIQLWGFDMIDWGSLMELVMRFSFNLGIVLILVRWLYYGTSRRKDYLFTYILISTIIFLLCYLLENVKLQIGFALGLFAIFGIIRYRTSQIPIKEMTYLFLIIGISVINALANKKSSIAEIVFTNAVIIFITYGFEKIWLLKHESTKTIIYEKIDFIKPEHHQQLIEDLQQRTGIKKINRIEIGRIDFLRDTCRLKIFYYETGIGIHSTNTEENIHDDDDD